MQNYNVTSVRASPITMSRRNWDMSPYKLQMNLVVYPITWFVGENNGFMGDFSSFIALTIGNFVKKH